VPIIPVSAFHGDNVTARTDKLEWHRGGTLIETMDNTLKPPRPPSEKPLRCVIQDIYTIEKERVAVCRVETRTLNANQQVIVVPTMEKGTVERIESFGEEVREALPGDSVGVVLSGIGSVGRGNVLIDVEEKVERTERFIAELVVFSDFAVSVGNTVTIRLGTAETECEVEKILDKIDPTDLTVKEEKPGRLEKGEGESFTPTWSLWLLAGLST
jgi:elongation factor 1-alpha